MIKNSRVFTCFVFMLAMGLSSISCSSNSRKKKDNRPFVFVTPNIRLVFPIGTNDAEQELLREAVAIQVREFKLDWRLDVISPPTDVVVFRSVNIPCGDNVGAFAGCHYNPAGPIHTIMGVRYNVPVIYHELVHHIIHDDNHADPRWDAMWTPRQNAIANGIWASRSGLNLNSLAGLVDEGSN